MTDEVTLRLMKVQWIALGSLCGQRAFTAEDAEEECRERRENIDSAYSSRSAALGEIRVARNAGT